MRAAPAVTPSPAAAAPPPVESEPARDAGTPPWVAEPSAPLFSRLEDDEASGDEEDAA
jgi:hypothetical protein